MATLAQLEIPYQGIITHLWPKMPEKVEGVIRVGCKYLYKPDEAYDLLLGADLYERPHLGQPWKKVYIAFVPNRVPHKALDGMVRQWVRNVVGDFEVIVTYQKGREIFVSVPGGFPYDDATSVWSSGNDGRRREASILA